MMDAAWFAQQFTTALPYESYVKTGTEEQQQRWQQVYEGVHLTPAQGEWVAGCTREMRVLVISGMWCGDCVQQCPLLQKIAEANPARILLRFVDRDERRELSSRFRINGGDRVPTALFLAEDHELCSILGDRTLSRYRGLATRQIGPSCPTGITPPDQDETAATLQDWLNEFERVQLMLRLSPRLREKHQD